MTKLLTAVTRAARKRTESDRAYKQAINAAREHGHTLEEIGQAAGLTKQGVKWILHYSPRKGE